MLPIISAKNAAEIKTRLLLRAKGDFAAQETVVREVLHNIETQGDEALFAYTRQFDEFDVTQDTVAVSEEEIRAAYDCVDAELLDIMRESAQNIRAFHKMQLRDDWCIEQDGKYLGQIYRPVERAGVYVPGGKAAYPSSVLMNVIPAQIAGVKHIYMATPAKNGKINPNTLVAAKEAGVEKIFKMGGAQAIAAFAFGTQSIPKVDTICGPGNIYVALAKKAVFGNVGVDMIAGPSEVMVIADGSANPRYIAADFLSQAEHDELAACVLVTYSEQLAQTVRKEILRQTETLPKRAIVEKSLERYGTIILAEDEQDCVRVANEFAPEHLEICTEDPRETLKGVRNAGSVFLGEYSPEPLGDYFAGTNHVLPTNGTAKFSSPLSVDNFIKKSSVICYTKEEFKKVYQKIRCFAQAEDLCAHARSAAIRFEEIK